MENVSKDLNDMCTELQKTKIKVDHDLSSEFTSIPLTLVECH